MQSIDIFKIVLYGLGWTFRNITQTTNYLNNRNLFRCPSLYLIGTTVCLNQDSRCLTSLATVATGVTPYSLNLSKRFIWEMCHASCIHVPFNYVSTELLYRKCYIILEY